MDLEEKVLTYKALRAQIEELEEQKKALAAEILQAMPEKIVRVAGCRICKMSRLSIKTPLETARTFGAVKMKEVVDLDKIKALVASGQEIPQVTRIEYIGVYAEAPVLQ